MLSAKSIQRTNTLRRARFASMLWTVAFGAGMAGVSLISETAYGQGPACGCELPVCESCAPTCDGHTCSKPRKLSFAEKFLKQADKIGDSLEAKMRASTKKKSCDCGRGPSCGAEHAPSCGTEHAPSCGTEHAPSCGTELPPSCGCESAKPTCGCEMTAPGCGVEHSSHGHSSHGVQSPNAYSHTPFVQQRGLGGYGHTRIQESNEAPPVPRTLNASPRGHALGKIGDVPPSVPPTASSPSDPIRQPGVQQKSPAIPSAKPVRVPTNTAPNGSAPVDATSEGEQSTRNLRPTEPATPTTNSAPETFTPRFPTNKSTDPATLREIDDRGAVVPPRMPSVSNTFPNVGLPVAPLPTAPKRIESTPATNGLPGLDSGSEQEIPDVLVDPFKDDARFKSRREKMNGIQLIKGEAESEPARLAPTHRANRPMLKPAPVQEALPEQIDDSSAIQIGATKNDLNPVVPINHVEIVPVKVVNPPRRIIDSTESNAPKVNRIAVPKPKRN